MKGLEALRLAVAAGWGDTGNLDTASDLAELRALPELAEIRAAINAAVRP